MDVEIHTAMIHISSTHKSCRRGYIASGILFVSIMLLWIACQIFELSAAGLTAQLVVGTLFVMVSAWTVWVIKTLYSMVSWWTDLYQRVDAATKLLEQTNQDIKEIKSIKHELSSR